MSARRLESAPIPALIAYYGRLRNDPDEDVAPFGFSRQKVSFRVVIEPNGELHAIQDAREQDGSRMVPLSLVVPGQSKPTGAGINPCFLWDNTAYMLGVRVDDPKPHRTADAYAAFKNRHLELREQIDDAGYDAVCRFLEQWEPADWETAPGADVLRELSGRFGVFQLRAQPGYVHDRPKVNAYWRQQIDAGVGEAAMAGQSLISGRHASLARLHEPKIKGVIGGQSSGGVLVGFNDDAYTSHGKSQSYNAPVADDEAFEYCTALNRLLARNDHRVRLGDATVVFWSDRPTNFEGLASCFFGESAVGQEAEDAAKTAQVRNFFDALRRGAPHEGIDDPEAAFYVLGLSPNAARISVRLWLAGTVRQFTERLARHVQDVEISGARDDQPLTIRRMLWETAREAKDIPPQLAGEVARAILTGGRYPLALFSAVLRRMRADQTINDRRAAMIKACLIRNYQMEVPVALNKDHPDSAYHMGRLFAAMEKTQEDSVYPMKLNKTIKGGYFSTVSSTPGAVFPRLIRLHQHHIEKLDGGLRINRERLIQEIVGRIDGFPAHLSLERQGLFHIGYYHQRQDFFTKRDTTDTAEPSAAEETANV